MFDDYYVYGYFNRVKRTMVNTAVSRVARARLPRSGATTLVTTSSADRIQGLEDSQKNKKRPGELLK